MGEFEESITASLASIEALIPPEPAAELGRYEGREWPGLSHGTQVQRALERFPGFTAERLLGALELGVAKLTLRAPAEVVAVLRPLDRPIYFQVLSSDGQSALKTPMTMVSAVHTGAMELITDLVRSRTGLLDLSGVSGDEAAIAAKHGAAHLALAVAVSTAVLRALDTPSSTDPRAIIGIAIGVTALLLPSIDKPPAYAGALLEKRRADYKGSSWQTSAPVFGHEFVFVEEPSPSGADLTATGLVAAVDTGFAVRTGIAEGNVPVSVRVVLDQPGEPDITGWDEVAEVSFTAVEGDARLGHGGMPPWPGEFRVRVHARGRDGDDDESYELLIWPAPHAEPLVHKKTDAVGHRVRGEPVPEVRIAPEAGLRWLPDVLGVAATVTVAIGLDVDDVVDEFHEDSIVVEIDGGVVVLEMNNYAGTERERLELLSRNGRAASHFWNVNAVRRLSFARDGRVLASEEPWEEADFGDDQEVAAALDGLDFGDWRHADAKGLTAVVRFTGADLPQDDLTAAIDTLFST
ncbi:DUF6461 domain-containing protein [Lentzea sp. NPDC059081]|uniref:DUF6461 domain-containing protein n=1 Tax=Lentzea sp. NPDC059081 TaxID=3346719 RepID=UPI0036B2F77B